MLILNCIHNRLVERGCVLSLIILILGLVGVATEYDPVQTIASSAEDQEEDSDENLVGVGNSTEGHLAYTDSLGRFRLGYPADAVITPLKDLPGGVVSFRAPGQNPTSTDIRITPMEASDIELEEHVSSVLAGLQNASIPNFKLIQGPECETYELGGEQVCSIIYNGDRKGTDTPTLTNATIMQLYSLLDSSLYNIIYNAPALDFNKNLNILRPMLASFETLSGPEDMPSIPRFQNLTVGTSN